MKKIKKIISIGSLSSLLLMPLVAASCKKNDNDEKVQIINNESNPQTSKQMTPPPNSINDNDDKPDKNEKTDNNQNLVSPVNPNETNNEEEKKKIEEEKKLKEKQEQEDKKNVEKVEKIIKEQKDAFGSFHTRKDFLDQISVFAKEKGIENLKLADGNEDKTFKVGENDPENKVKLRLGTYEFEVQLGKVLKDRVATKYYIENDKEKIIEDTDGKFSNLENNEQNVVITQIGYSLKSKEYSTNEKVIEIDNMPKNTKRVPKHLPLKIKSLKHAFKDFKFEEVSNLDKWNVSNVELMNLMFYDAEKFNQDISSWDTKNVRNMLYLFYGAKNFNKPLNSWNVSNVRQMSGMFYDAISFNQNLNDWNVSNVIDMEEMFQGAISFNGKIDDWNVNNVERLSNMFLYAHAFSHNLSKWKINKEALNSTNIFNHNYIHKNEVYKSWGYKK
ncbi:BspA family leucine-rich repeat surface protein [Mycoplasmopsis bovis]|uniref:BspA family leucine-rich repeat surface protein n=1 Tax=Mycoplasmopsis bovis TaxID=28903 RepID=UPI000A978267|nr:BspA family leucine-rich repeat surface protein [Mycoplasmopsis bovis]